MNIYAVNYDRVFEYSIYLYLTREKKCKHDEAKNLIKQMEIIHPHEYLGNLDKLDFGSDWLPDEAPKQLRTVWDKKNGFEEIYNMIYEYVTESDRIFFLGFGYLKENLEVLGIKPSNSITRVNNNILSRKEVYGTAKGLSKTKITNIENLMKSCGASKVEIKDYSANDLIKEYFDI